MLAVMAASSIELHRMKRTSAVIQQRLHGGSVFLQVRLLGTDMLLVQTGVGPRKAGAAARHVVEDYGPSHVLSVGAAGALDPTLEVGDVVVIEKVGREKGTMVACDPLFTRNVSQAVRQAGFTVRSGNCLTVKRFVHLQSEKECLFKASGAQVVDMESAAIAEVLCSTRSAFADVRVISDATRGDTVDMNRVAHFRKRFGRGGTCLYYGLNPRELLRAIRLSMNLYRASAMISRVVQAAAEHVSVGR